MTPATRIALPYICGVSEATARLLAPHNVSIAHRPEQTLRTQIMRPKEPLPNGEQSSIVYRINCRNCPCNYVGETAKRLRTRVHEHELAIKRQEQRSQVWAHMANLNHTFDLENAQTISRETTKSGRLLKEAWLSDENSINRHIDLLPAYQTLRRWEKQRGNPRSRWPSHTVQKQDHGSTNGEAAIPREDSELAKEEGGRVTPQRDSNWQDWSDRAAGEAARAAMGGDDKRLGRRDKKGGESMKQEHLNSCSLQDQGEGATIIRSTNRLPDENQFNTLQSNIANGPMTRSRSRAQRQAAVYRQAP